MIGGGGEFKGEMEQALTAWHGTVMCVSAAEHYESHGLQNKKLLYGTEDHTL